MGPHFDNDTSLYVFNDEVFNSHWILHNETNEIYLVPRNNQSFDVYGPDDDVVFTLTNLDEEQLEDDDFISEMGFSLIFDYQRRFNEEIGYYIV